MKRLKRKIISILIIFCVVANTLFGTTLPVFATSISQSSAVQWAKDKASSSWWQDVDGSYGCQCVDLIMAYYQYLGESRRSGNATDYQSNSLPSGWTRVKNNPQPGDIAVWAGSTNLSSTYKLSSYGHIGIVVEVSGGNLKTVETNVVNSDSQSGVKGYANAKTCSRVASYVACYIRPNFNGVSSSSDTYEVFESGNYCLINTHNELFLNVLGGGDADKQDVVVSEYAYENRFNMRIDYSASGSFIRPSYTSRVINPLGYSVTSGLNVSLWPKDSDGTQLFSFVKVNGGYKIVNRSNPSCVLSINSNNSVIVETWNGSAKQIWLRIPEPEARAWVCNNQKGHSWNGGVVTTQPSCTGNGVKTYTCTRCNGTKNESVPAKGHSWNGGSITTQPTCTATGVRTYTCTSCSATKTESVSAQGHTPVNDNAVAATCISDGKTGGTHCSVCNTVLTAQTTIAATGHSWDSGVITKQPTSTEMGERTYTCTKCSDTKIEKFEAPISITKQPVDATAVDGSGKVTFSVAATGTGLNYQWYWRKNSSAAWAAYGTVGTTNTSLRIDAIMARNGFQYYCEVTDSVGTKLNSSVATLTVKEAPPKINIVSQPVSATAKDGSGNVKFSVMAVGTGLTYQWYWRKNATTEWGISGSTGAKTATLTIDAIAARNGFQYYCEIKDVNGGKIKSNAATLTVTSPLAITKQPVNVTAENGSGNVNFSVMATGTGLTYQWFWRKNSSGTWAAYTSAGAANSSMSVGAITARNGFQYYCKIKDSAGTTVSSNVATLTVKEAFAITKQPVNVTAANGSGNINFSVTATGNGLTYQWFWRKNSSAAWASYTSAGTANSTMSVGAITARNGFQYYCLVKDSTGKTIASNVATLKIVESPFIIKQPTNITAKNGGSTVKFNVEATGAGLTYQWYWRKNAFADWAVYGSTGAKTATLSIDPITARNGFQYFCAIKDSSNNIITTDVVTLTVTQ